MGEKKKKRDKISLFGEPLAFTGFYKMRRSWKWKIRFRHSGHKAELTGSGCEEYNQGGVCDGERSYRHQSWRRTPRLYHHLLVMTAYIRGSLKHQGQGTSARERTQATSKSLLQVDSQESPFASAEQMRP